MRPGVPPIIIDNAVSFLHNINILPPKSILFFGAIALVAEVSMHLLPLAVLTVATTQREVSVLMLLPVVLTEPAPQLSFSSKAGLQAWLVFGNATLMSAAQILIFRRYGFEAMFGLRDTFSFVVALFVGFFAH